MNEVEEQRVIEALRAIRGGLTVTEHDIAEAGSRLQKGNTAPPRRRRPALLVAAAAAAVALVAGFATWLTIHDDPTIAPATGPGTPADVLQEALGANPYGLASNEFLSGEPVELADLPGLWAIRPPFGGSMFVSKDGAWSIPGLVDAGVFGPSTIDGSTWSRSFSRRAECRPDDTNSHHWTTALAGDGSLRLEYQGSSNTCTLADKREVWDRLVPGSSALMDYLRASEADAEFVDPDSSFAWPGLYVNLENGHLFNVAEDGGYAYFRDVSGTKPVPSESGTLELEPGAVTIEGSCGTDDRGAIHGTVGVAELPQIDGVANAWQLLRLDVEGCALHGSTLWARVPPWD